MLREIVYNNGLDRLTYREGSGKTVEIFDIAVGSERRKGIGRALVSDLMDRFPQGTVVWAITRSDNCGAQRFYEGIGFRTIGVLRSFYEHDPTATTQGERVDAVMYGKQVGGYEL